MNWEIVYDIEVVFWWITFITTSILVMQITDQLYFFTFATVVFILLSILGILWLIIIIIAVIICIITRIGLTYYIKCGSDITKQFEEKFLSSDFDRWEIEKSIINERIEREVLKIFFLVDLFHAKQDASRVSRFLFFWKEVRLRVDLIIKEMNTVEWDESRLSPQNYLKIIEALRQLDCILRTHEYWDQKFEFLSETIVKQKHRQEFESLMNDAVIPEERKHSFILKAMSKSLISFEENLKQNLQKLK